MRALRIDEWLERDRAHPAPTFFARPAWAQAMAAEYPSLIPSALCATNGVVVPTMRTQSRMHFRDHVAFPLGGYTAFLDEHNRPVDDDAATDALDELVQNLHHLRVTPWPLAPQPRAPKDARVRIFETATIDCSHGLDPALANVRGVTRRMAGQAERRGVTVERAGSVHLDTYYEMLVQASVGWGLARPPISRRLLDAVFSFGGDDAQLWLAYLEGEPIAGGVILFGSDELFFWSAAMRRECGRYRPSNALNLRLIRAACERGVRWYNLGASEGLEGVARFKSDLGAASVPYPEYSTRHAAFALYEHVRARVSARRSA